jgi:hypothetical protein
MMADIADIILAIEQYLAKTGKGKSYLADKIAEVFESDDSPFNVNGTALTELRNNILDMNKNMSQNSKHIDKMSRGLQSFAAKLKNIKLPDQKSLDFSGFGEITQKLQNFGTIIDKASQNLTSQNLGKEKAVKEKVTLDVNVQSFSNSALKILSKRIKEDSPEKNTTIVNNINREKEEGSILGSIFKTIFGGVALLAGAGFIAKFLETPQGLKMKEYFKEGFSKFAKIAKPYLDAAWNWLKEKMPPLFDTLLDYVVTGAKALGNLTIEFFKSTFNFFGLKGMLGPQFQGVAVLLTKAIYYGVSKIGKGLLNFFSFGVFGKIENLMYRSFKFIGGHVEKFGEMINGFITKIASKGGTFGKVLAPVGKLLSGTLFKTIGKQLMKRIPIIGSFISFKDAYDRFQQGDYIGGFLSVGSGLANFVPGIGTVISIGIDLLNAFIDYKASETSKSKGAMIVDFLSGIRDKIWNGLRDLLGDLLESLNPVNWFKADSNDTRSLYERMKSSVSSWFSSDSPTPTPAPPTQHTAPTTTTSPNVSPVSKIVEPISEVNEISLIKTSEQIETLNKKFDQWISLMEQGFITVAGASVQGSNQITNAVLATANSGNSGSASGPVIVNTQDPITQYRIRAQRAIEYNSR